MTLFSFKKYNATIKVVLSDEHRPRDPTSLDKNRYLPGYYRPVSVYAESEGDAVAALRQSIADGRIDWSCSDLVEVQQTWRDRLRAMRGCRVTYHGGRAFFPSEDEEPDGSEVGWRLKTPDGTGSK